MHMTKSSERPAPVSFRDATLSSQLAARTPEGESLGLTAKEALHRYFQIMAYELGSVPLTAREWIVIRIAMQETVFSASGPAMLGARLYAAFEAGRLGPGWDDSATFELMSKLDKLPAMQLWAVIDALERWRIGGEPVPQPLR